MTLNISETVQDRDIFTIEYCDSGLDSIESPGILTIINGPGQSHKLSAPGAAVEERYDKNLGVGQSTDVFSRSGKSIPIYLSWPRDIRVGLGLE